MDAKESEQIHDRYQDTGRIHPMMKDMVEPPKPQRVSWRLLQIGSRVWAPTGKGWTPGTVARLGQQRDERTVVYLVLHGRGHNGKPKDRQGTRYASQLFWRKTNKDKPS